MTKILLAEDDDSMRQFLSMALKRAGHEVQAYEDGETALEALEREVFDLLLLTDIVMPGLDGIELARRGRRTRSSHENRVYHRVCCCCIVLIFANTCGGESSLKAVPPQRDCRRS